MDARYVQALDVWMIPFSAQLIDAMRDWSDPVQMKFELDNKTLVFRKAVS